MIITSEESLMNPFHLFAGMMNWMNEAGEDFLDYNCNIVSPVPFIAWLSAKGHISSEKANALLTWSKGERYRSDIKEVLMSPQIFPTTYGESGLGLEKAYALLADYASNFKEFREEIFEALNSSIAHDEEGRSIACVIDDSLLEDIPINTALLKTEYDTQKLNYHQLYKLVSSMSISECDSFFLCQRATLPNTLYAVSGAYDLKDPLIAFCVIYKHLKNSNNNYESIDDNLPHVRSFISWLVGKGHIKGEIADELLTSLSSLKISTILQSNILFPKTQGMKNFGIIKACTLLAEFISEFDIFRFAIYDALAPKDDKVCSTFLIEKAQLTEVQSNIAQLKVTDNLAKLTYYQLYHLASSMSVEACDCFFNTSA